MPRPRTPDLSIEIKSVEEFWKVFPTWAGREAVNFYHTSFERQGWLDKGMSKWKPRKTTDKNQKRLGSRAILVRRGKLRRSIRMRVNGKLITIFTDIPYAQVHNEGGKVQATQSVPSTTVRAHKRLIKGKRRTIASHTRSAHTRKVNFTMPKRQFMDIPGQPLNSIVERRIVMHLEKTLDKLFK